MSERARDDRFTAMLIGIIADVQAALGFTDEDKECSNGSLEIVAAIRELKEQALTQQRGELPSAKTFASAVWRDWMTNEQADKLGAELHAWLGAHVATTPQPSADAVRELVKRWRECAKSAANGPMFDGASEYAVAGTYIACADELESLLSVASGEKGVGK